MKYRIQTNLPTISILISGRSRRVSIKPIRIICSKRSTFLIETHRRLSFSTYMYIYIYICNGKNAPLSFNDPPN